MVVVVEIQESEEKVFELFKRKCISVRRSVVVRDREREMKG